MACYHPTTMMFLVAHASKARCQASPKLIVSVLGGPVSSSEPQVTIVVSASFSPVPSATAVAQVVLSLGSSDPSGTFSSLSYCQGLFGYCPGGPVGTPNTAGGVDGVSISNSTYSDVRRIQRTQSRF